MSPEQARGDKTDQRTDIYSLGVVLYEMLAGRVPFEADTTMSVLYMQINEPPPPIEGISPGVQTVMNRALAKNPNDRYQTCREMAADFFLALGMTAEAETIIETLPPDSLRFTEMRNKVATPPPAKETKRNPLWLGVGLFSIICLLAVAFGASKVFSNLSGVPTSNETQNPANTDVPINAATSVVEALPSTEGMIEIPSGTYEVGVPNPSDEYHSDVLNVLITGFWIDKYQTTNAEYQEFMEATGSQPSEISGEGNQPVRGVTWDQAFAYCSWKNKRLLIEAEWEAAGRGPGANPQLYPWGNDVTAGGQTLDMPDQDTYPIGTQPFNESIFGVSDMVGNVWEWVDKPYDTVPDGYKILRGGRYGLLQDLAYRLAVASDDTRYIKYSGFRCAADKAQ